MTAEWALPGVAVLVLIVVWAIRFAFRLGKAQSRISSDVKFVRSVPSQSAMPGMFDDEEPLPYRRPMSGKYVTREDPW